MSRRIKSRDDYDNCDMGGIAFQEEAYDDEGDYDSDSELLFWGGKGFGKNRQQDKEKEREKFIRRGKRW